MKWKKCKFNLFTFFVLNEQELLQYKVVVNITFNAFYDLLDRNLELISIAFFLNEAVVEVGLMA